MNSFQKCYFNVLLLTLIISANKAFGAFSEEKHLVNTDSKEFLENQNSNEAKLKNDDPLEIMETEETKENFNAPRGMASNYEDEEHYDADAQDHHEAFKKRAKPLKNIFMGIYKNYKSTYLGNKTTSDYKKRLRERISGAATLAAVAAEIEAREEALREEKEQGLHNKLHEILDYDDEEEDGKVSNYSEEQSSNKDYDNDVLLNDSQDRDEDLTTTPISIKNRTKRKNKRKHQDNLKSSMKKVLPIRKEPDILHMKPSNEIYHYDVGSSLNVSLDMGNDVVTVKMDGNNLRELISGRWLQDSTEEGRGKKYEMVTKVLPLFILPFLIQSAVVPFLVTKLKLLLVKSILIGKLAIFLLIISAIKNSNKPLQTYEVAPSYWAGEPSRRSELATSASSMAYNGYRVEGKPSAWIN